MEREGGERGWKITYYNYVCTGLVKKVLNWPWLRKRWKLFRKIGYTHCLDGNNVCIQHNIIRERLDHTANVDWYQRISHLHFQSSSRGREITSDSIGYWVARKTLRHVWACAWTKTAIINYRRNYYLLNVFLFSITALRTGLKI